MRPGWLDVVAKYHKGQPNYMGRVEFVTLCILAGGTNAIEAGEAWDDTPEPD